jgi:4-amino-4-deoxy-L-arabinose transferase-like glycosyltransferase
MGTEASWLLPAALIGLAAGVWFTTRAARAGRVRANLLWGGWLLVTGVVFSLMRGVIHPYYTVALAPAIAALIGISVCELWRGREFASPRTLLATMAAITGVWAFILLDRTPTWFPAMRWIQLIGSIAVASVIAVGAHRLGRATAAVAAAALLFGIAAPAAYATDTVARTHHGPLPTSGPDAAMSGPGPAGPQDSGGTDNAALQALLRSDETRWTAASVGSMTTSRLALQTGASVMAIGGFRGSDNSPTLQQFQQYVDDQQIHYFIAGRNEGGPEERSGSARAITAWVRQHFTPTHIGGTTVYDLFSPTG